MFDTNTMLDEATIDNGTVELSHKQTPIEVEQNSANAAFQGLGSAAVMGLSAAALAACSGGEQAGSAPSMPKSAPKAAVAITLSKYDNPSYPSPENNYAAARFLPYAGFAATDPAVQILMTKTYGKYLEEQFNMPIGQTGFDWLDSRGYGANDNNYYQSYVYPAEFMVWNQLFTGEDTLRRRCALALSEFFVVSMKAFETNWSCYVIAAYWDKLMAGAFGNFRQLLEEVTLSPAMGLYLNTWGNLKEDPATGRLPDENYAREIMQLFSIGLYQLNIDGTEKLDAAGNKIETYTIPDVSNLAKVFTGYTPDASDPWLILFGSVKDYVPNRAYARKRMIVNPANHSNSRATFLGVTIPANTSAEASLKIALDTLFNHPNVAPFFAKQMIQRLVTSNPSPAYVARVAAKFNNNGLGVRGDLKAVWAAILTDSELLSPAGLSSPTFGKVREPLLRLVQWGRTFGLKSAAGSWKIFDLTYDAYGLGQSPLRSPSVFNFFRPGYVPPNTALAAIKAPAPEMQIATTVSVGGYLNFMQEVTRNGFSCPQPTIPQSNYFDLKNYQYDITPTYPELQYCQDAPWLVNWLGYLLCGGRMSQSNKWLITNALNANPVTAASSLTQKLDRVAAATFMVMSSSEYMIQR
jgi:uncharacterized protein (DUF1800 family)